MKAASLRVANPTKKRFKSFSKQFPPPAINRASRFRLRSTPLPANSSISPPVNISSKNRTSPNTPPNRWPPTGRTGSKNIPSSPLKTAWPKTIGPDGRRSPIPSAQKLRRKKFSSSATIFSSPTPSASPAASTTASPTRSSSSSIKSAASLKPLTPSNSPAKPDTTPSFPTAAAKPKTHSSPTLPLPPAQARSRPAPPPEPTASPNTISFFASKKNSAPPQNSLAVPFFREENAIRFGSPQTRTQTR